MELKRRQFFAALGAGVAAPFLLPLTKLVKPASPLDEGYVTFMHPRAADDMAALDIADQMGRYVRGRIGELR